MVDYAKLRWRIVASVIGHADRVAPLDAYCVGLLLPCERKSVEPMHLSQLDAVGRVENHLKASCIFMPQDTPQSGPAVHVCIIKRPRPKTA
jgi:SRSO17 transposase